MPPRRKNQGFPRAPEPDDWRGFGTRLKNQLGIAREKIDDDLGGFDDRRLIKVSLERPIPPEDLRKHANDVEIVSQEDKIVVLAFASDQALDKFEAALTMLESGGKPKYRDVLFALQGFDRWSPSDRTGWALKAEGWPESQSFLIDVELWPIGDWKRIAENFEAWLKNEPIEKLDSVKQPHVILYRLKVSRPQAEKLLQHRDIRTVDLPPMIGLEESSLAADIQQLPTALAPPAGAPGIAVLDSGLASGHPLLKAAVGDSQSFIPGKGPEDEVGHGTHVSGIALYGDVDAKWRAKSFVPTLRLFSGRILNAQNQADGEFIENHVDRAVRYFHENYGCRVFNLSYGDLHKPYRGGHVRGLAVVLDTLARELGVLFVLPTGNFEGSENVPADWRHDYPGYLLTQDAALLDPAPALNALTVGGLARWERTRSAKRHPNTIEEHSLARADQPSPFTRSGPSVGGAIKPDLVAYAGNWSLRLGLSNAPPIKRGLGELSTSSGFAEGRLLTEDSGTSYAAPHIAHLACRLLGTNGSFTADLLRALLAVHARWPHPCSALLDDMDDRLRVCGYGRVQEESLESSNERVVTMLGTDTIAEGCHHFYEVPLPDSFLVGRQRTREISVALAYSPPVRTTRVAYKGTEITYRLVWGNDLEHVSAIFNAEASRNKVKALKELGEARIGCSRRDPGTLQADTWTFKKITQPRREQKLFLVVTRVDETWASGLTNLEEPYALVVTLRDSENAEAQLYTQLRTKLQQRVRERLKA